MICLLKSYCQIVQYVKSKSSFNSFSPSFFFLSFFSSFHYVRLKQISVIPSAQSPPLYISLTLPFFLIIFFLCHMSFSFPFFLYDKSGMVHFFAEATTLTRNKNSADTQQQIIRIYIFAFHLVGFGRSHF